MNSAALRARTRRRRGRRRAPRTPSEAISSALSASVVSSFGAAPGRDDRDRVRLEGHHGVGAARSPRGARRGRRRTADRDARGRGSSSVSAGDLSSPRKPTTGQRAASRGSARRSPVVVDQQDDRPRGVAPAIGRAVGRPRRRAPAGAPSRRAAAGTAQRLASASSAAGSAAPTSNGPIACAAARCSRRRRGPRSASARRSQTSTRSERRAIALAPELSNSCTVDLALGSSTSSPAARPRVGALAVDLDRRVGGRALAHDARRQHERRLGHDAGLDDLPLGVPVVDVRRTARRPRRSWAAP